MADSIASNVVTDAALSPAAPTQSLTASADAMYGQYLRKLEHISNFLVQASGSESAKKATLQQLVRVSAALLRPASHDDARGAILLAYESGSAGRTPSQVAEIVFACLPTSADSASKAGTQSSNSMQSAEE